MVAAVTKPVSVALLNVNLVQNGLKVIHGRVT